LNFDLFLDRLFTLQRSITITSPVNLTVRRAYWGAPSENITDLPCFINTLSETERVLGMGTRREEQIRINMQLLAARARPEDERSSRIASAFWFAAKNVFDADTTIGGSVVFSTLQGANPTVPVLLQHSNTAYIGFDAVLVVTNIRI